MIARWCLGMGVLILLSGGACVPKEKPLPDSVIPPDKMVRVLVDMHLAEAQVLAVKAGGDTATALFKTLQAERFSQLGIDTAQFQASMRYYTSDPVRLDSIYNWVVDSLTERQNRLDGAQPVSAPPKP